MPSIEISALGNNNIGMALIKDHVFDNVP